MKKLFAIVAFMIPVALMAQEEKPEAASVPASETAVQVAAELSKYGYAHSDALSLIQAARMAKRAGMTQEAREKAETQGGQRLAARSFSVFHRFPLLYILIL